MCFEPLGIHAGGAMITDVRVEEFDGLWAGNVGGGAFLVYYDGDGAFVYAKEADPTILYAGPCLSNASFTQTSVDGAIDMTVFVQGGRTDQQ